MGHQQFAQPFYNTAAWRKCREGYRRSRGGLCERCLARGLVVPGAHVHHKVRLIPENLTDPGVTLNWANLELLCEACHQLEHQRDTQMRTDERGHVAL